MKRSEMLVIILAVILTALLLGRLALPAIGGFLVAEDEPMRSDIIIVLMGSGPDRMMGAVDLYRQGYAKEILVVRNLIRGYDLALERGVEIPHDTDIAREVALQLRVSAEKVTVLPGDALSTRDEAVQVREHLKNRVEIDSIIIVTSRSHSARAKKIFVKAMRSLEREVRVTSCPTPYDDFNAGRWWKNREELKSGFLEYLKLSYFYLKEQFEL